MIAWMAVACGGGGPWSGAPAPPSEVAQHQVYTIEVRGKASGTEERWIGREDGAAVVVRRRTWEVILGGEATTLHAASRVVGDGPVEAYVRWIEGESTSWTGAAWVPDAVPPPESGLWPVLEPWTLEIRSTPVTIRQEGERRHVAWTTSAGTTQAVFDAAGLVHAEHGAIRMVRGAPDGLAPFDPAALFAIPVAPRPNARRSLVGRFEVDGTVVRTDAPVWAEVRVERLAERAPGAPDGDAPLAAEAWQVIGDASDQRTAVERLVRHVAGRLDGQPRPGSLAAVDALRSGRGDCDEAANAFVALARAVGLEAEPVGGLIYANGAVGPGLYPHAWAQVRFGGGPDGGRGPCARPGSGRCLAPSVGLGGRRSGGAIGERASGDGARSALMLSSVTLIGSGQAPG